MVCDFNSKNVKFAPQEYFLQHFWVKKLEIIRHYGVNFLKLKPEKEKVK